jgi:hypothetical protein
MAQVHTCPKADLRVDLLEYLEAILLDRDAQFKQLVHGGLLQSQQEKERIKEANPAIPPAVNRLATESHRWPTTRHTSLYYLSDLRNIKILP